MRRNRTGFRFCSVLMVMVGLIICFSAYPTAPDKRDRDDITYKHLRYFKEVYAKEIYDFCVRIHTKSVSSLALCLRRQLRLKNHILSTAQKHFGLQTLAQAIYDDCLGYYPVTGVGRIAECINSRLTLNTKVGDYLIEKAIYHKCYSKWLKHGFKAIDNCCIHSGNYYRRYGKMEER